MKNYIKPFSSINESIRHDGIILIKGKKNSSGDQRLYAGHVIGSAEIRPGATMLFLSNIFYLIKSDSNKLKGHKISYNDEDSLKSVLNLKSPGKISIVKNNNKTPYHWKTLKYTNIVDALDSVKFDIPGHQYLLESGSTDTDDIEYKKLATKILSDLFINEQNNQSFVILNWVHEPNSTYDDVDTSGPFEMEAICEILYLDTDLPTTCSPRFNLILLISGSFNLNMYSDIVDEKIVFETVSIDLSNESYTFDDSDLPILSKLTSMNIQFDKFTKYPIKLTNL